MTKEEVFAMWKEYFDINGVFPKYARCCIQWHDDFGCANVTIALVPFDVDTTDDEKIFFYCNGIEDLQRLVEEEVEDFSIRDVYRFSLTL